MICLKAKSYELAAGGVQGGPMGRRIIISSFLLLFGLASWFFITRQGGSHEGEQASLRRWGTPLTLATFTIRNYRGIVIEQELRGGRGQFTSNNCFAVNAGVWWKKNSPHKPASVVAEQASVFLQESSAADYLSHSTIERIIFVGKVTITFNTLTLRTEKAIYLAAKNILYGREKVSFRETGSLVHGNQGFHFDLDQERYQIFGEVRGELRQ